MSAEESNDDKVIQLGLILRALRNIPREEGWQHKVADYTLSVMGSNADTWADEIRLRTNSAKREK